MRSYQCDSCDAQQTEEYDIRHTNALSRLLCYAIEEAASINKADAVEHLVSALAIVLENPPKEKPRAP